MLSRISGMAMPKDSHINPLPKKDNSDDLKPRLDYRKDKDLDKDVVVFKGDNENPGAEKFEKMLAIGEPLLVSSIIGSCIGGIAYSGSLKAKSSILIGLGATAISGLLTIPAALYTANYGKYPKSGEADTFVRSS